MNINKLLHSRDLSAAIGRVRLHSSQSCYQSAVTLLSLQLRKFLKMIQCSGQSLFSGPRPFRCTKALQVMQKMAVGRRETAGELHSLQPSHCVCVCVCVCMRVCVCVCACVRESQADRVRETQADRLTVSVWAAVWFSVMPAARCQVCVRAWLQCG